jgi:hypothetical protein
MEEVRVMGISISDRVEDASKMQGILTKYGCTIRTRLGLHEASKESCSRNGLIIIELVGDSSRWMELESELKSIKGIFVKSMDFTL